MSGQQSIQLLQTLGQLFRQQMSNVTATSATCEQGLFPVPSNATKTVYVEGLPADATEREVAHMFRPF